MVRNDSKSFLKIGAQIGFGAGFVVEAQLDLFGCAVRAVSDPALVRKDRTNIAVEINRTLRAAGERLLTDKVCRQ